MRILNAGMRDGNAGLGCGIIPSRVAQDGGAAGRTLAAERGQEKAANLDDDRLTFPHRRPERARDDVVPHERFARGTERVAVEPDPLRD